MSYGVNKFGDHKATVNTASDELNMHGHKIVGLPTHIGALTGDGDAVSHRILLDVMEKLHNILLRTNGTNRMTGDMLMDSSNNDSIIVGCVDFGAEEKSFTLHLGNYYNGLLYNTLVQNQPVTLYTSNGFLVKADNRDTVKFNRNKIDLLIDTDANGKYIYNLPPPLHNYDACTKEYVDAAPKKCHVGLIPALNRNVDKSGYEASASSQQGSSYAAYKAFRSGNTEWTTAGITTNFWIKIKCLQAVKVWKFVLTGRRNDNPEQIHNWRFEGSNDDSDWMVLHSENSFTVNSAAHQFNVENNTNSYQYYRIFVLEASGPNPGLSHVQLFVYSD